MSGWTAEDLAAHYQRLKGRADQVISEIEASRAPKPRKRGEMKEAQVERQIIDLLTVHGWLVLRTNKFCGASISSQGAIEPGMPDLMARKACGRAAKARGIYAELAEAGIGPEITGVKYFSDDWRILWIEVKRPGGKVSTIQATWHQLARKRGETVLVAEFVDEVAAAIGVAL